MKIMQWQRAASGAAMAVAAALSLGACGGGGDPDAPERETTSYITWSGNGNGEVVVDRSNDRFRVRSSDGVVESLAGGALNGLTVSNAVLLSRGTPIGVIKLIPGTGGGSVAAFVCNNGAGADIIFNSSTHTYTVDCGSTPAPPAPPPPSPSTDYITWSGSKNGTVILDRNDEHFRARRDNGQVETESGTRLNGLVVSGTTLLSDGSVIGSVVLAPAANGGNVAAFRCTNGNFVEITLSSNAYSLDCGSTSAPPRYINWNGSANGEYVLDNSNDAFRVNADTLEVIDQSGARLLGTRVVGASLSINSVAVASVRYVASTTGTRVVGFVCNSNNHYLEIYDVSPTQFRYTCEGTRLAALVP